MKLKNVATQRTFLFVDEVININKNSDIHAKKFISEDEYFLQGHFPNNPIFPGVIIIELGSSFWNLRFCINGQNTRRRINLCLGRSR